MPGLPEDLATSLNAFEERYLDRARDALGPVLDRVGAVSADRSSLSLDDGRLVLAGWWTDPVAASDGIVVAPNPWGERSSITTLEKHVWAVTTRVAERIAPALDAATGAGLGLSGWRLVLDPWLVHVMSALADRSLFWRTVRALVPDVPVLVDPWPGPPATMGEGIELLRTDAGTRALGGLLAGVHGLRVEPVTPERFAVTTSDPDATSPTVPARSRIGHTAAFLSADPGRASRLIADAAVRRLLSSRRGRRIVVVGLSPFDPGQAVRVARRVRGLRLAPRSAPAPAPSAPPTDPRARAGLARGLTVPRTDACALESLALSAMAELLPRSVLEGDAAVVDAARRRYGPPADVIVGNYAADEVQNRFLAWCDADHRRLLFAQHGGFYLQAAVNAQDRLEQRRGSTFLSWGGRGDGIAVAPAPRLERLRDSHRGGDAVMLLEPLIPPDAYVMRFASTPLGNQAYADAARTLAFVNALGAARRHLVLKRFPRLPHGTRRPHDLAALAHRGPVRSDAATAWMGRSRMAVITYPDTPLIEAMLIGVPVVGLWDPGHWELRKDAREPFAALRDAGVLFDDPRAAAAHVDDVYTRADAWWASPAIRAARTEFLERFAVSDDWRSTWPAVLRPP